MFFTILINLIYSKGFLQYIQGDSFEKIIEKRSRNEIWIVMFRGTNEDAKPYIDFFMKSSKYGNEAIKYGIVDIGRYMNIVEKIGINLFPHLQIYHSTGSFEYEGNTLPKDLYKTAVKYLIDLVLPANESWKEDFDSKPSAIYFSKNLNYSINWKILASIYSPKSIRFGFSNDPTFAGSFEILKLPSILLIYKEKILILDSKLNLNNLIFEINNFFLNYLNQKNLKKNNYNISKFQDLCIGGKYNCIIINSNNFKELIYSTQKLTNRYNFLWFIDNNNNFPFEFMNNNKDKGWIYNPRKDSFVIINNLNNINNIIDNVISGQAKWIKKNLLINNEL